MRLSKYFPHSGVFSAALARITLMMRLPRHVGTAVNKATVTRCNLLVSSAAVSSVITYADAHTYSPIFPRAESLSNGD